MTLSGELGTRPSLFKIKQRPLHEVSPSNSRSNGPVRLSLMGQNDLFTKVTHRDSVTLSLSLSGERTREWGLSVVAPVRKRVEGEEATYSHVKPQVLLLLEEEIQDKLPHEIRIASVFDHLRPAELHPGTEKRVSSSSESRISFNQKVTKRKKVKERS